MVYAEFTLKTCNRLNKARTGVHSSYYNEILHELRGISMEIRDELDLCATGVGDFEEDEFLEFELWKTASDAMEEWFVPQVEQLQQRAVKLFLGWIWNDII